MVGTGSYTFLLSSFISIVYKNLLFLFAVLLNHNEVLNINVFLFWCVNQNKTEIFEARNLTLCHSLPTCFSNTTEQKIRICQGNENYDFFFYSLILLFFFSLLSVIASIKLENFTSYINFYESTGTFLYFFETKPVVHRSLVFTLASSDEHQGLLEEVAEDTAMINRPRRGETPFHYSTRQKAVRCTEILLRKGALLKENGEEVVPPVIELAVQNRYAPILDALARNTSSENDRKITLSLQQDQTLLKTSLNSPALVRSMLNLILALETTRDDVPETPQLEFLRNRLRTFGRLQDRRQRREDILDGPTIVSLLRWKNQSGRTVLQDRTVDQDNLKMMLSLAWSLVNRPHS